MLCSLSTNNHIPLFFIYLKIRVLCFFVFQAPVGVFNPAGPYPDIFPNPAWGFYPAEPYFNFFSLSCGADNLNLTQLISSPCGALSKPYGANLSLSSLNKLKNKKTSFSLFKKKLKQGIAPIIFLQLKCRSSFCSFSLFLFNEIINYSDKMYVKVKNSLNFIT